MRKHMAMAAAGGLVVACGLGGCATNRLVGTWKSDRVSDNVAAVDFDFAAVTFAPDGTYTAEMIYGGRTLAQTGTWELDDGVELEIGPEPEREYGVTFEGPDAVTFDAGPQGAVTMRRYRPDDAD